MKILLSLSMVANAVFMRLLSSWKDDGTYWEVPCIGWAIITLVVVITFIAENWE